MAALSDVTEAAQGSAKNGSGRNGCSNEDLTEHSSSSSESYGTQSRYLMSTGNIPASLQSLPPPNNYSLHYPSLPTPPYTPFSPVTHGFDHTMQNDHIQAGYIEENNNMDENSNDLEYDQYSHYHEQHYLAQQHTPQPTAHFAQAQVAHRRSSMIDDMCQTPQSSSSSGPDLAEHNSTDSLHNIRSVRPRTAVNQRRVSLTPQSSYSLQHNQTQETSAHDTVDRRAGATLPLPRPRSSIHKTHRRNSSYDSGMTELYEQECRRAEFESAEMLPTLPPRGGRSPGLPTLPSPGAYGAGSPVSRRPRSSNTATEREAELLLYNFTQEELSRDQLALPQDLLGRSRLQDETTDLLRAGTELRKLADAFAATAARAQVRCMAEEVLISAITWDNFASLCMQLFSGSRGITAERIVALFTFIADVAKQQIKRGAESCIRQLMVWSLRFICERVCEWVHSAGGWGRVLHQGLDVVYRVAVSVAAVVAVAAMTAYIARTYRHW